MPAQMPMPMSMLKVTSKVTRDNKSVSVGVRISIIISFIKDYQVFYRRGGGAPTTLTSL